jgi:hypothetical protein
MIGNKSDYFISNKAKDHFLVTSIAFSKAKVTYFEQLYLL